MNGFKKIGVLKNEPSWSHEVTCVLPLLNLFLPHGGIHQIFFFQLHNLGTPTAALTCFHGRTTVKTAERLRRPDHRIIAAAFELDFVPIGLTGGSWEGVGVVEVFLSSARLGVELHHANDFASNDHEVFKLQEHMTMPQP